MRARGVVIAFVVGLATVAGSAAVAQQTPPRDVLPPRPGEPTTATISGIVTAAETGMPIRGVDIRVSGGAAREPRGVATDQNGRYEVSGLAAGQYTLVASKVGYMTLTYGQARAEDEGKPVQVTAAQAVRNIDFALPRGAVITVKVVDALGDPVPGVRVIASQRRFSAGERKLTQVAGDSLLMTDDRGELRLSGLGPGEYFVSSAQLTSPGTAPLSTRAYTGPTFYPGVASEADAQPITVGLGEETFVAMALASTRVARISGEIVGNGRPMLRLERRGIGGSLMQEVSVSADSKTFTASNLTPGEYVLTARADKEFGVLRFQLLGEDLTGMVLSMAPAVILRGRFTFDGGAPRDLPPQSLVLRPLMTETRLQPVAQIKNDFSFEIPEANGTGVLRFEPVRGWYLKSVLAGGRDVTDTVLDMSTLAATPLNVVLTQRTTEVRGRVLDAQGKPAATYVVVVFPEDRGQWTPQYRGMMAVRPDQTGGFTIRGLPDGRYLAAAVDFLPPGDERDPKTLERLHARATPIVLAAGDPKTLDLRLVP